MHRLLAAAGVVVSLAACQASVPAEKAADLIFTNGHIITINDAQPTAQAVAIKDGLILAVGSNDSVLMLKGDKTQVVDLGGKTMIPGFVDGHSHFSGVGLQAIAANLLPPPDGPVNSIPKLQQALRDYMATSTLVKQYGVVIGMNYDDAELAEHRSPTRQELDAVSTTMPIVVTHQSGHLGVYNTAALKLAGITAATPNPTGGVIKRETGSKQPNGVMEETAHFMILPKVLPQFTPQTAMEIVAASQAIYESNGFTTAQDGATAPPAISVLAAAGAAGKLQIDVVAYPLLPQNNDNPALHGPLMSRRYTNGFRIGGVKLVLDGSPQGRTAWLTKPFYKVPAGQPSTYHGYPAMPDKEVVSLVTNAYQNNWQVLAHANGNAAIDQLIKAVRAADSAAPGTDRRTVMIHGQMLRQDQVAAIKQLGIFPALFPMHTFYWGDWHRQVALGPVRAENISPTGWMLANAMKFSIHSDAPVTLPNSMRVLGSAVTRTTRSGYVLGPDQRIDPLVGLKAMTIWPAYQHFEETTKGSIEVGKIADLVILSDDPLAVDRAKIIDIKVLETIKNGKTIFKLPAPRSPQ